MSKEQFEREKNYQVMVSIARNMVKKGLISKQEYKKIDTIMFKKYRPLLGSLCRGIA
jgi:hypothetical protein